MAHLSPFPYSQEGKGAGIEWQGKGNNNNEHRHGFLLDSNFINFYGALIIILYFWLLLVDFIKDVVTTYA
jgi:hypothetical protein